MDKQQLLKEARRKLAQAVEAGCRIAQLVECIDDGDTLVLTLTWYADMQPESFVVAEIYTDGEQQVSATRALTDAVNLLHQVADRFGEHRFVLSRSHIITIEPKYDPVFGHTFKFDTDLLDFMTGQITEAEYAARQKARRIDREGGCYRGDGVPGGV